MNPTWSWDVEFVVNVATIAALGLSSGYAAHCVWQRNKAGRRDRLVWGLLGFFNAIFILFGYSALVITGVLPELGWLRWGVRFTGISAGVLLAIAVKQAEPLVYLSDLRILNERILNKRRLLDAQEHQIAAQERELDLLRREVARLHALHPEGGPSPSA